MPTERKTPEQERDVSLRDLAGSLNRAVKLADRASDLVYEIRQTCSDLESAIADAIEHQTWLAEAIADLSRPGPEGGEPR
jgi:hypothetical protein